MKPESWLGLLIVIETSVVLIAVYLTHMKVSELAGKFTALVGVVDKIAAEVQKLKDSLSDVDLPPEAEAALANLEASLKKVDDINPDEPPPTT